MASHTRNVAGYKLKQISRAVYEQTLEDGSNRWFVHFRMPGHTKELYWRYTELFNDDETPKHTSKNKFDTLTDAVLAANK